MESVAVFLDYANINRAARDNGLRLDYKQLLAYLCEGRFLSDAHCYVPIDPRSVHRLDSEIQELWESGYIVTTKIGNVSGSTYKCNLDIEMAMDVLRVAYHVKPAIVVLATGDFDFVPLVLELRRSGIRVEVASFETSAAHDMVLKCSGFISLDHYLRQTSLGDGPSDISSASEPVCEPEEAGIAPDLRANLIATQTTDHAEAGERLTSRTDEN
jgi:uncharacterized LabA/DUF88 family protein